MNFVLEHPSGRDAARAWLAKVILCDWLGLSVTLKPGGVESWCLSDSFGSARLLMPDTFFGQAGEAWLAPASVPSRALPRWRPDEFGLEVPMIEPEVPLVAGKEHAQGGYWHERTGPEERVGWLGLDVFGSAFFLLSRYEEVAAPVCDAHDRFPASASLAAQEDFLERPLVDEYIEILWSAMLRLWPGIKRPQIRGQVRYSCDVDAPYEPSSTSPRLLLRALAGDIIKRHSPAKARSRIAAVRGVRRGNFSQDPNHSFERIMDLCEAEGHSGAFYFISGHSAGAIDGCYTLDEAIIGGLLRRIYERGHEIGMHGSYNSFRDLAVLQRERAALLNACEAAGAPIAIKGNRQHFLRWDSAMTPSLLALSGFDYDTTGGFADRPGFRYGTARRFAMWDWREERALTLIQQPLIVMECSVIAPRYLGLGYSEEALGKMLELKSRALRYGGDFTLLWHNSHLDTADDWRFLHQLLA